MPSRAGCGRFIGHRDDRLSWLPTGTVKPLTVSKQRKPIMVKRIVLGVVYTVVLYFVGCTLLGGVVGGMAGAKDPQNAAVAGARASAETVPKYAPFMLLGACAIGVAGTATGVL